VITGLEGVNSFFAAATVPFDATAGSAPGVAADAVCVVACICPIPTASSALKKIPDMAVFPFSQKSLRFPPS
jgi:hypothetical protein